MLFRVCLVGGFILLNFSSRVCVKTTPDSYAGTHFYILSNMRNISEKHYALDYLRLGN